MKKSLFVFAALATFALVTGSVSFGSSEVSPGLVRLTSKEIKRNVLNYGSASRGPGDVVVIRQLLYNKGLRSTPIGHSDMVCTFTGNRSRQCNGTYSLPRGKITVSGSVRYWEFYKLAIIGGTDLYSDIRGFETATLYARGPRKEILVFRLV
jgi:hypothetical protein